MLCHIALAITYAFLAIVAVGLIIMPRRKRRRPTVPPR